VALSVHVGNSSENTDLFLSRSLPKLTAGRKYRRRTRRPPPAVTLVPAREDAARAVFSQDGFSVSLSKVQNVN